MKVQLSEEDIIVQAVDNMLSTGRFNEACAVLSAAVLALCSTHRDPEAFLDVFIDITRKIQAEDGEE